MEKLMTGVITNPSKKHKIGKTCPEVAQTLPKIDNNVKAKDPKRVSLSETWKPGAEKKRRRNVKMREEKIKSPQLTSKEKRNSNAKKR